MSVRDRIVEQATEMFISSGAKSVRMDDIASELGMSKRTLYELFGDKGALILECVEYLNNQIAVRQKEACLGAVNVIEMVVLSTDAWKPYSERIFRFMSDIRKFYPRIYDEIRVEQFRNGGVELKKLLKRGVEEGLFIEGVDIELSAHVYTSSMYLLTANDDNLFPTNASNNEIYECMTAFFFRGMATEKGVLLLDSFKKKSQKKS